MGCDIHAYSEYRKNEKWHPGDGWTSEPRADGVRTWRVRYHLRPSSDRNYGFFSWLCGVRSGTWGESLPQIDSEPRGIPDDLSDLVRGEVESWSGDGHSHGWITLKELDEAWREAKDLKIKYEACVSNTKRPDEKLKRWLETPEEERGSPPYGYCAGGNDQDGDLPSFVWYEPMAEVIGSYYDRWRDYLWSLSWEYKVSAEDVRIVYFFDN